MDQHPAFAKTHKMSLPVLPNTLTAGEKFPYPEGTTIEFKQANTAKLADTLCAFLNTQGGYYIIGVRDDGVVCGIDRKLLDARLCTVDSILRGNCITHTETKESVTDRHITCTVIPLDGMPADKFVLAICAKSDDSGDIWQRPNAIVRRLHASNWIIPTDRQSLKAELDSLRCRNYVLEENIRKCVQETKAGQIAIGYEKDRVTREMSSLKESYDKLLKTLYDHILAEKEAKEKEMRSAAEGVLLSRLCCGLF